MLPGFRFLFAAIVLTLSTLVFGLGAAALLRAAHEQFAATPSRRAAPEPKFARTTEAPVLAMLRLEPVPVEVKVSDNIPAVVAAEPPAIAAVAAEPEKVAALKPDATEPEAARPKIALPEAFGKAEATAADVPAPAEETRLAAVEQVLPPTDEAASAAPPIAASAADTGISTRIATLGGPPVTIEPPANADPDRSTIRKRDQARRAKERRRAAQRARLARQAAVQQQAADPFAQPAGNVRSR